MSTKKIYFVRHAEAEGNVKDFTQTPLTPLTENGHKQALVAAKRFKSIPIDVIIASEMVRAQDTARYIAKAKELQVEASPLFHEFRRPTSIQGSLRKSETFMDYAALEESHYGDPSWRYEDGETFADILKRCAEGVTHLEKREEKNILVVSHGRFMRFIISYLIHRKELSPETELATSKSMVMNNTGITLFEFASSTGWKLITWNDHAHFAE